MDEIGLTGIADALVQLESCNLGVYPLQCVRLRHRKAQCTRCADVCPEGAIIWGDLLHIDAAKCTGCGLCAAVCLTGVFEANNPSNPELLQQINLVSKTNTAIAFACPRVAGGDASGVVRVPCLGRLDESVLIGAVAAGIQQVSLVDCECAGCPNNLGHSVAEQVIDESNAILHACGMMPRVGFAAWSDLLSRPTPEKNSRTEACISSVTSSHEVTSITKGELPVRLPLKRELLLSGLQCFASQVKEPALETRLWATVSVTSTCSVCQMCAFFCPTGALFKVVEGGKPGLAFKLANCTNCQLCREICYTNSIKLSPRVDLNKVIARTNETIWSDVQTSSHQEKIKRLKMFR